MAQQRLLRHETLADYVPKVYTTQYLCLPQHRHLKVEKFAPSAVCLPAAASNLNESPRPKAGKCLSIGTTISLFVRASMKVPARRRGNRAGSALAVRRRSLNESPRPKAGKLFVIASLGLSCSASMKVPTRRRGNAGHGGAFLSGRGCLNESPHPKAGKSGTGTSPPAPSPRPQ